MSPAQQNIIRRALKVLNPFPPWFDLLQSSRPEYLKVTISTVKVHFDGKENDDAIRNGSNCTYKLCKNK